MANILSLPASEAAVQQPQAADWLWRPWYAKLWWVAIPLYWAAATVSLKTPALSSFFESALAGYLNLLFFPFTALLVLGFGFVRAWFDSRPVDDGSLTWKEIEELERIEDDDWLWDHQAVGDIYDPMSGTIYIGNPLSPNNGSRV